MSRQEKIEILKTPPSPGAQEMSFLPEDPSGNRELAEILKLIDGSFFQTTKCCATGTCR